MNVLAALFRSVSTLRFRLLGLATIDEIPTARFKELMAELMAQGWQPGRRYRGFDAGIDYDCIRLRKGWTRLKCEWDHWTEGSIEGRRSVIQIIADRAGLPITHQWRWAKYD